MAAERTVTVRIPAIITIPSEWDVDPHGDSIYVRACSDDGRHIVLTPEQALQMAIALLSSSAVARAMQQNPLIEPVFPEDVED